MKKGFTLIELLAVIILLSVLSLITVPIISNTIKTNKEKIYNSQLNEIEEASEKWAYQNLDLLPSSGTSTITLLTLKQAGLISLDLRDPRTNTLLPNDMTITIAYENNNYSFLADGNSGTSISSEMNINAPTIVLNGNKIDYVEFNGIYNELGAIANDVNGDSVNVEIQYKHNETEVASITTNEYKTYTATYSASYNGYTSYIVRTIIVRDTTAPVLTIPDNINLTVAELATFNLLTGVTVTDNSGETISATTSGFDTLPGKHIVSYTACDSHNNCDTKKRIVTIES